MSSSEELFQNLALNETEVAEAAPTELDLLKNRARLLNVSFSNNIGLEALKAKVQAKLDGDKPEPEVVAAPAALTMQQFRDQMYAEQMKLIRVRITNLNPNKKDLPGEIFTFANRILGAVRKFVPYGEATENGYHIPFCIYTQLKEREFVNIRTRKDSRGREIIESGMAREFALEVLDPLTEVELARLAASQAAKDGTD